MSAVYVAVLLALALALFWASKFQLRWFVRLGLIALGAGALGVAAIQARALDAVGVLALAADFVRGPNESILLAALTANARVGLGQSFPMLGFFVVLTGALGVAALLALLPGKTFDRIAQGASVAVFGMIAGAALALAVVAIGFGGPVKQSVYIGQIASIDDVHDGDTFRMGDVSIRLNGIDAPETSQFCWNASGHRDETCSELARMALVKLLMGKIVVCSPPEGKMIADESFGRPIMDCRLEGDAAPDALNRQMVAQGFAISYRGTKNDKFYNEFGQLERQAMKSAVGLMQLCFLDPKTWRRAEGKENRTAFGEKNWKELSGPVGVEQKLFGTACATLIESTPIQSATAAPGSKATAREGVPADMRGQN
jgi:endonuclease YncB( thermonuclease family)